MGKKQIEQGTKVTGSSSRCALTGDTRFLGASQSQEQLSLLPGCLAAVTTAGGAHGRATSPTARYSEWKGVTLCVFQTHPLSTELRSWLLGITACSGCMRVPGNHWGDLWERLEFPGNQMRPGCQRGERIHHVSQSRKVGACPSQRAEAEQASERPLGRGKRASCRT